MTQKPNFLILLILVIGLCFVFHSSNGQKEPGRKQYLEELLKVLPPDRTIPAGDQLPGTPPARVSPEDLTWGDWLERTGELPPDFDQMPSLPFLPDPLILDEGGQNIPVTTIDQWHRKREEMKREAQHWITGTVPPPPGNLRVEVLKENKAGDLIERDVLLQFGPEWNAQLHVTLLIPPGEGPFPVFICPWKEDQYDWVQAAVRRGYIGCRFTATDPKYGYPDDSEAYEEIWWPDYDFSTIMRWGWAASRAIDYLYTLEIVNREQIALTGLSRNGKMALWAAAYDDRVKAVIPISGGTGGEVPFRYTADKYKNETIQLLTNIRPHWLHPRLRFFVGRESKLPVDQNSLMALIAPRGLMLTSSISESAGNPWGVELAYLSARRAYAFLGAEDRIAVDHRQGLHAPSPRDMERYLDFFDYVFDRTSIKPDNTLLYDYSFSKWLGLSREMIDPLNYPEKGPDDLLLDSEGMAIKNSGEWNKKKTEIIKQINRGLGEEPPSVGPGQSTDYLRSVVGLPRVNSSIKQSPLLFGQIYYPEAGSRERDQEKMPVVIYLHEYSYSKGFAISGSIINQFTNAGFAVYVFDQIGFGHRVEEGSFFYERFPNWSKMGRMVADTRWTVDALSDLDFIDNKRIYVCGYALGGAVGLYSAALDDRIAGAISVCGFSPMRVNVPGKTAEGVFEYSHLHGLLPRLGFFTGKETRIPYDFDEILACIAPRPLMVIAPSWDQYADSAAINHCMEEIRRVYDLFGATRDLEFSAPEDYNRFSYSMLQQIVEWLNR